MIYFLAFLLPLALVLALTPPVARLAERLDFTDKPTERKKHTTPVPLSGGVVMFIGCSAGFFVFLIRYDPRLSAVLLGGFVLLVVGVIDDYSKTKGRDFPAGPRFLLQIAAAALVYFAGIRFTGFFNPLTDRYLLFPGWLQFALTVLWIVGLTNVINFMDGLDGLAGGLCTISGFTLLVVALVKGQPDSACMAAILLGATAGFLRYNLPPRTRVYMGDSGAYLLGYLLAVISLYGAFKQATVISVFIPVLAMGVPIFDNILVTLRRLRAHKPIYEADTTHITQLHYRLLKNGMKPGQAVAFIFLISVCLNLTSIIILLVTNTR